MKKRGIVLTILIAILAVATIVAFAGCKKVEELIFAEPENIAYDGSYITWDKCDGAKHYMVSINNGDATRSNSTTYAYETEDSFDVTITAIYENVEKKASTNFKPLSKIETFNISDNGTISWDAVSGANAYSLTINGQAVQTTDTTYDKLPEGSNRVKVKPIVSGDNSFYSWWSSEQNVYIYSAPNTIKYDGTEISWMGNASQYLVKVNGQETTVTGNKMNFASGNKDFSVELKALGNHTSTYDSKAVVEEFHYLDTVTEIFVEDGIVKWNGVQRAEGYKIKIDGIEQKAPITATEYANLATGKSQDIALMPYNNSGNYFSSWSAIKTVYILDTPKVNWNNDLELDGEANNNFTWDAVNAANGYTVRLTKGGQLVDNFIYSDVQRFFTYAYAEVGVYTIEVKTNATVGSTDYFDSKFSTPIIVERLAAPKATSNNFIVSKADNLAGGFTVNFVQVNGASGYQMYKDGALLNGKYTTNAALNDTNVADSSNMNEQHYTYKIRSMGGVKTSSGKKYVTLPCLTASALSFDITVQATPQNPKMSGFNLSWDAVSGNNGYCVSYSGISVTAQSEILDLSTINAGTYSISVCAKGNGGATLASNYSSPVAVQRLEAPTEIKITADNNGTLKWKDVSNAKSYQVFLDLSSNALDENAFNNMYQFIETNGTTLSMVAVANYYNNNNTLYYMTSQASPTQQFIRLAAPTFPEGALQNSIELLWNAPSNINTSEYTPTYKIFSAIDEQIGGGVQNGTKFNIEYLEGGNGYRFLIKAIGNDTKYLDSEYSLEIEVYKIATPELKIENGQYVWNGVTNASGYILIIDGKKVSDEFHISGSKYAYTPRFTTAGDHIVKLQAIGDAQSNGHNLNSAEYKYTQKVDILLTPQIDYSYSSNVVTNGGSIIVTIKVPVANCTNYQFEIAGESIVSAELTYTKIIQNTGKFPIRVKALGGSFDDNGVHYIDSQYAGGSATDNIVLLGKPSESSVSINSDGVITWNKVDGNFGYEYQISYDGGEWSTVTNTADGRSTIEVGSDYKKYRTIKIHIRAKGSSDGKTITSEWTEWTWTNSNK